MGSKVIELHKILYPEKYESEYIYTYAVFNEELRDIIGKSGYEKDFKIKYCKSLRFLENLKRNCIMNSNLFEKLVNAEELYSVILKGIMNIRIIFDFQIFNGKEVAILYTCFVERKTKDYEKAINIAILRRLEIFMEGEFEDGK